MSAPFTLRSLTVEEVFAEVRIFCEVYGLIPERDIAKIQPDLSIEELGKLCYDEADWVDFLPYFGLALSEPWWGQWKSPLTIRDLCIDIASQLRVPVSEPVTILGNRCETAGMFLMMKQLLAEDGANTSKVAPSTPIKEYARRYPHIFCRVRLAKRGRLPEPCFHPWAEGWLLGVCVGSMIASTIYCTVPILSAALVLGVIFGGCAALFANGFLNPYNRYSVCFLGIVTFRDFIHAAFDRPSPPKIVIRSTTNAPSPL